MSSFLPFESPDPYPPPSLAERLTVAEYQRIVKSGVLNAGRQIEFLEGVIVSKFRRTLRHDGAVEKVQAALQQLIPNDYCLRVGAPIATAESQPEPDVSVVRKTLVEDVDNVPDIASVGLVIEVADGSIVFDRRTKGRIYARAGLPYYWVLDLIDSQLEVYSQPSGPVPMPGFQDSRVYRADDAVAVIIGEALGTVRVIDMLP